MRTLIPDDEFRIPRVRKWERSRGACVQPQLGTRGGCGSLCTKVDMPCRGCYGPPPGVTAQGAKLLSALASVVSSDDPAVVERIMAGIEDPAGTFYRFSLASALLPGAQQRELQ